MTLKVDSKNTSWPKLPKHQQHINNILSVFGKSKQSHNKGTKMQIKRAFQNYSFLSPKKKQKKKKNRQALHKMGEDKVGGDKGEDYMSATELLPRKVSIEHVLEFYFN